METAGALAARPQHCDTRGPGRAQPHSRDALLHEPGARQWRQATRNFGNHHASRVLLWLGQWSQPELLRRTFFHKERSVAISCLPHRPLLFHWTRTPKQNVQPEFNRISETSLPDSCSTRPMFCFEICGCVQTWHRVTEV